VTRDEQVRILDAADRDLLAWANEANVPLLRIEHVFWFVESRKGLAVWLFYDSKWQIVEKMEDGTTDDLKSLYLLSLSRYGYDQSDLIHVDFVIDSDENVREQYDGSYFSRLRGTCIA
jgi:hypothetical protein